MSIILADLGGTHLRLARLDDLGAAQKYIITQWPSFTDVLRDFAPDTKQLFLASAVQPRQGVITDTRFSDNPNWVIDLAQLRDALGLEKITVLNDLEAAAWSVPALKISDQTMILDPTYAPCPVAGAPKMIVGIGTGIGHAYVFETSACGVFVQKTHGGHFPPIAITKEQRDLLDFLRANNTQTRDIIFEDIVSGTGILMLRSLYDTAKANRLFSEFLGLYCGLLVSAVGAYAGVYLCGGAMDEMMRQGHLDVGSFTAFFKRPMVPIVQDCMASTPVVYVTQPHVPILGLSVYVHNNGVIDRVA